MSAVVTRTPDPALAASDGGPPRAARALLLVAALAALTGGVAHGQENPPPASAIAAPPSSVPTQSTINERIERFVLNPHVRTPLERGARDARESAVLKGEHGLPMQVLLALQRGRWDIAVPPLLLIAAVLGGLSLLGRLFRPRRP